MLCPNCRVALERKEAKQGSTELDRCPRCQGIWFDKGEIAAVIGARAVTDLNVPPNAVVKENLKCPRCDKPLWLLTYPGTVTVIEGCKTCRGVWLDAGEINAIAKARADRKPRTLAVTNTGAVPGMKGSLIRFIDESLEKLWSAISR